MDYVETALSLAGDNEFVELPTAIARAISARLGLEPIRSERSVVRIRTSELRKAGFA